MTLGRVVISLGGVLQLIGIALIFWQIHDVQVLFRRQTWTRSAVGAALSPFIAIRERIRPRRGRVIQLEASDSMTSMSDSAELLLRVHDPVEGTTEERLNAHRRQLEEHDRQLDQIRQNLRDNRADVAKRIDEFHESIRAEATQLRRIVDEFAVGSLGLQAFGAVLILVGTALTIVGAWLPT